MLVVYEWWLSDARSDALLRRSEIKTKRERGHKRAAAAPADVSDFADCTYEPARRQPTTAANVWAADGERKLNQPLRCGVHNRGCSI
ncbi:hypothetical protein Aduo_000596 [Ancylostoma duodenale]